MAKQIADLTTEVETLKEEIKTLKDTIHSRNLTILELLNDQKQLIADIKDSKSERLEEREQFPLQSIDDLEELEAKINSDNIKEHIKSMRMLVGYGGVRKNLSAIIGEELIVEVNLNGLANKVSLSTYTNFMNALYQASGSGDEWNLNVFVRDMQYAIKTYKNRIYKIRCLQNRSKTKGQSVFDDMSLSEDDDESE